jgi:hypothetical protein
MTILRIFCALLIAYIFLQCSQPAPEVQPGWPEINRETKPWTRWWWHGSALTKEGITTEMEAYKKAGLGGVEITPIYGVLGYEEKFVNYLTPQWIELLIHTLKEGERLDLGIDMATGTGWPFGGPWVSDIDACKTLQHKIYDLKGGERLAEKIEFIQQPFLRAVGNQIYEVHESFSTDKTVTQGTRKEPLLRVNPKEINISQLKQPVESNKNLQALALDQVIFERSLRLVTLIAYSDKGETINLTDKVDNNGRLNWSAGEGNWKLYAIFEGSHGKMVERAGPGGEGNVIDHFSGSALKGYLSKFDSAFAVHDISTLRAFFNDSYEVDDALGAADWTPSLFDEFEKRKGYKLEDNLPALLGNDEAEKNERVLSDYRETISELVLKNFTTVWRDWAHAKSAVVRNQAHGSPSNILDLYAEVDIPEIEGVEPLRMKMASSAGNVVGKKLVSSESATWLNEHFESNLSDIKVAVDRFLLNGINHVLYHGTTYSPPGETWPGWLFYASIHMNPRNSLWTDADLLNQYITRCQSFLQRSSGDNDVLLYFPIYDRFATRGEEMVEHFDGVGKQFDNTAFRRNAETMLKMGYTFDYISDAQIKKLNVEEGDLITEGNAAYKTIVIPHCRYLPVATFEKVIGLAKGGATVIITEGLPESPAGFSKLEENKKLFDDLLKECNASADVAAGIRETKMGQGRIIVGDSIDVVLSHASVQREAMVDDGIQFIRKKEDGERKLYLIANGREKSFDGWLPLSESSGSVAIYDPMTGEFGSARIREASGGTEVFIQLTKNQTLILETYKNEISAQPFRYISEEGDKVSLSGKWKLTFLSGGPTLPPAVEMDILSSWVGLGNGYTSFSGTASYTTSFKRPVDNSEGWMLDLGVVKESAEVLLNGKSLAKLIGPVYRCYIDKSLLTEDNILEVRVSNLMANRIADLDKSGVFWKKFYNINFPARKPENRKNGLFDASQWTPRESGLIGPVVLQPVTTALF